MADDMEVTEHFTATAPVARGIHAMTNGANIAKNTNQHCQQTAVRDRQIRHEVKFNTIPNYLLRFSLVI